MTKKITVVFDDELVKKLRIIHAKKIAKSDDYVSFSKIINQELRKVVK